MNQNLIRSIAFLALGASVSALADQSSVVGPSSESERPAATADPRGQFVSFKSVDADGDGYISKREAKGIVKDFDLADVDDDGRLSPAEFAMEPKITTSNERSAVDEK